MVEEVERAFSPAPDRRLGSRGVAPGWYGGVPLALRENPTVDRGPLMLGGRANGPN